MPKLIRKFLFKVSPSMAAALASVWEGLAPVWSGRMSVRNAIKYLWCGLCPGVSGKFTYHRTRVYFPKRALTFRQSCESGTYEPEITDWLCRLAKPGELFIDVGTNIGLTSIPVLRAVPTTKVLSFEPSPNTLPYLQRTQRESGLGDRWEIVGKAAGAHPGTVRFYTAGADNAAFDGLRDTGRGGARKSVEVELTTVDLEWKRHGHPAVSCLKIDVEGAETQVLRGAANLIAQQRPPIVLEWNRDNLISFDVQPAYLLAFAQEHAYDVVALPHLALVSAPHLLQLQMLTTEMFLLIPRSGRGHLPTPQTPDAGVN